MPVERISDAADPRLDLFRDLDRVNLTRASGRFIAEGRFVVERLISSRFPLESVVLTEARFGELGPILPLDTPSIYVVPRSIVKQLVGFDFHSGVLACGRRQPLSSYDPVARGGSDRLTLVACPRTTDPVNLGNIIRLCRAFDVQGLLLGSGCADPFSRRVLRVSMGNGLHLPIVEPADLCAELLRLRDEEGVELAGLVLDPAAKPLQDVWRPQRLAILFGHESEGLTAEWLRICQHRWTIPMTQGTDSLNVAAATAIVLYQLATTARQ